MNHSASLAMPRRIARGMCHIRRRILHPVYSWSRTLGMKPQSAQHIRCKTSRPRDSRLHTWRTSLSGAQLVEQGFGVLQVRGVEALGEPVVDLRKHRAGLVAPALLYDETSKAGRRSQLPCFRTDPVG